MSDEFKDMPLDKLIELWREYDTVVPKEEILRVLKLRDQLLDALQAKNNKAFLRWMSEGDDPERHYKGTEIIAQYRNDKNNGITGSIVRNDYVGDKQFLAVTINGSKTYKTLTGAKRYMLKEGYVEGTGDIEENNA